MEQLEFENENTWPKALNAGEAEEFHQKYETAVTAIRKQFGRRYQNIIDGKEVYSSGGEFEDRSPNDTRIVLGRFQKSTREDAAKAVEAAAKAFREWSQTDYQKRTSTLQRAADLFSERKFELAAWMSFENGKNRFEAIGDVDEAIDLTRYY